MIQNHTEVTCRFLDNAICIVDFQFNPWHISLGNTIGVDDIEIVGLTSYDAESGDEEVDLTELLKLQVRGLDDELRQHCLEFILEKEGEHDWEW